MTAFATAIEMLFADPNIGVEAIYTSDGGAPAVVRAVVRRADEVTTFTAHAVYGPARIDPGFDPAMKAAFEGLGLADMLH